MGVCMGIFVCMYVCKGTERAMVCKYVSVYVCKYGTYVRCTQAESVCVVCVCVVCGGA